MARITGATKSVYETEMAAAQAATVPAQRWSHLERAHIVSQPYPWLHTRNHAAILKLALAQRDRREALRQVLRIIVAAPGSPPGRYPAGNTGHTAAGLMTPMPVPPDLANIVPTRSR